MLRSRLIWLAAAFLAAAAAGSQPATDVAAAASQPVVRVSQGFFPPDLLSEVRAKLEAGRASLDPALRALPGLLHYYVAIDPASNSIVNVSVWESLEAAAQMNSLEAMRVQRDVFVELGIQFQPIRNYSGVWSIAP